MTKTAQPRPMKNVVTLEHGELREEPVESRFNFMLYVERDGEPHELGYWHPREWERDGWTEA